MYKLGTCQYVVLVPLCKEAFANKEFTTTTEGSELVAKNLCRMSVGTKDPIDNLCRVFGIDNLCRVFGIRTN